MTERAVLGSWLWVPHSVLGGPSRVEALKETLVHVKAADDEDDGVKEIRLYDESRPGFLGLPREFGLARFPQLALEDRTSLGAPLVGVTRRPDPNHPRVRNPEQQRRFMADLLDGFRRHRSFIACAVTGAGKTTCGLNTAAELGRRTLILVHLERLADQWMEEIADKLGVDPARIGRVQSDKCEWRDKDFSVGILHSVCLRDYEPEFYRAFGLVIFDEVHKVGSQFFAPAVSRFPSRYRLGLSATPKRRDGGDRVFFAHLGPIRVNSQAEALPMTVHVVNYDAKDFKLWGSTHGSRVKCLTGDARRDQVLCRVIQRFWEHKRQALVVSDSVLHLQRLMAMAEQAGVPRESMGQYTAEIQAIVPDSTKKGRTKVQKRKQSKEALDQIKAKAQIIFATYGMMTEGIDIPRLDAGLDATPRWEATQLIGRIRRPVPGKRKPIWVTVRDIRCSMSQRYFRMRQRDYESSGAAVVLAPERRS